MVKDLIIAHKFFNKESKSYVSDEKYYRKNYLRAYLKFMQLSFLDWYRR